MFLVNINYKSKQMIHLLLSLSLLTTACNQTPIDHKIVVDASVTEETVHKFSFNTLDGKTHSFSEFKGKKILIVNTASKCGYTKQYEDLEKLYQMKKDRLVIVAFPSDSFLQEYNEVEKIEELCRKFDVSFFVSTPSEVRGRKINPLFEWLIKQSNPDFTGAVEWNFEKFILNEEGQLIHRYRSKISPLDPSISSVI